MTKPRKKPEEKQSRSVLLCLTEALYQAFAGACKSKAVSKTAVLRQAVIDFCKEEK